MMQVINDLDLVYKQWKVVKCKDKGRKLIGEIGNLEVNEE